MDTGFFDKSNYEIIILLCPFDKIKYINKNNCNKLIKFLYYEDYELLNSNKYSDLIKNIDIIYSDMTFSELNYDKILINSNNIRKILHYLPKYYDNNEAGNIKNRNLYYVNKNKISYNNILKIFFNEIFHDSNELLNYIISNNGIDNLLIESDSVHEIIKLRIYALIII